MVSPSDIGKLFGASKATITKYYQRSRTERQAVGRPLCMDRVAWDDLHELIVWQYLVNRFPSASLSTGLIMPFMPFIN
jgi:hypothetical protein